MTSPNEVHWGLDMRYVHSLLVVYRKGMLLGRSTPATASYEEGVSCEDELL